MTTYTITPKAGKEPFSIDATGYSEAAQEAVRIMHGKPHYARRVTGDNNKSGMFAAYRHDSKVNAEVKVGTAFHVMPE